MAFRLDYDLAIVIPVKKNSTRVPNKNSLPFANKNSLLEWKISQLLEIIPPDIIYVSTDSENFKDIAKAYDVNIHHRDAEYCDEIKTDLSDVIYHIINDIDRKHIAWIPVTSPLMSPHEYQQCFNDYKNFVINGAHDSLIAVNTLKDYIWDEQNPVNYQANTKHVYSQHLPNWFKLTNSAFITYKDIIMQKKYFIGSNPYKIVLSKLAGIDIDEWEDYEIAKSLLPLYYKVNNL